MGSSNQWAGVEWRELGARPEDPPSADRARSKLQTMTNTALINAAERHGVDLEQGGRIVSKKHKIARLMMCQSVVDEYGRKGKK